MGCRENVWLDGHTWIPIDLQGDRLDVDVADNEGPNRDKGGGMGGMCMGMGMSIGMGGLPVPPEYSVGGRDRACTLR